MSGIVNVNKPRGMTSRAAVDVVKRLVRPERTGHAGTLDPLATGVLVVCVGRATRLIEYVQRMKKHYRATFLLGRRSATDDVEAEVTFLEHAHEPTRDEIDSAAAALVGEILQRPPVYSAIKVSGKRAYDLARAGKKVDLQPRPVKIHDIDVVNYAYPTLTLDIRCGSGTYVRALGRDLAEAVGSGAVMSALERTAIGHFCMEDAWSPHQLAETSSADWLLPSWEAVRSLESVTLDAAQAAAIAQGRFISLEPTVKNHEEIAARNSHGELLAVLRRRDSGEYGPKINL